MRYTSALRLPFIDSGELKKLSHVTCYCCCYWPMPGVARWCGINLHLKRRLLSPLAADTTAMQNCSFIWRWNHVLFETYWSTRFYFLATHCAV